MLMFLFVCYNLIALFQTCTLSISICTFFGNSIYGHKYCSNIAVKINKQINKIAYFYAWFY